MRHCGHAHAGATRALRVPHKDEPDEIAIVFACADVLRMGATDIEVHTVGLHLFMKFAESTMQKTALNISMTTQK